MADPIVTPAVEAALVKAGPKVAAALGMDAIAGVSDVAAGGEAGLNPLADGAAVVSTPIAAANDAEAIAGAKEVLETLAKSPGGRRLLEQSGKTVEEIAKDIEARGPEALKAALDTPAGKGALDALKATWDKAPPAVRGAIAGATVFLGEKVADFVVDHLSKTADATIEDHSHKPVTISTNGGAERPMASSGLTGRVVSDDGKNIDFRVGRETFTLHNLPPDRFQELMANKNDLQHIAPAEDGRMSIADLSRQANAPVQTAANHGGR